MFRGGVPLDDSKTTMAEVLREKGYQTAAVSGFTQSDIEFTTGV